MSNARRKDKTDAQGAAIRYAALPYRVRDGLELLLITSRGAGRWVLPKGWPMKGRTAHAAAPREALEEAGLKGRVGKAAFGVYGYGKRLADERVLECQVVVYPFAVERQVKRWLEKGQRNLKWFSPRQAADHVEEPELADLIEAFATSVGG